MKNITLTLFSFALLLFSIFPAFSQLNLTQLGYIDLYSMHGDNDLSDVWGYVDPSGNEYAIVGLQNGTSVCHVTSPATASEVFFEPGMSSIWRDMKVWNDHAFITTEATNGLLVIDLSTLSAGTPVALATSYYYGPPGDTWESAHNLFIDENGVCYIFGANRDNGGCIMLDVTDPTNIIELGKIEDWYVHDGVCKNDTLYLAHISDGFMTVWDVADKTNPVMLGSSPTPGNFSHNIWFSDDLNYVYTTDEIPNGYIGEYNVSDPTNIFETDRIQSSPGMDVIPHNAHFLNDYVITSYYRDGITIHDVSNKGNMVEVGNFDTSPAFTGDGFNGCWGAYPWLPSGNILASDIENGLYILGPNYQRACFLEGNVTDFATGAPINDVLVEIVSTSVTDNSDIVGDYAAGYHAAGTYDVIYSNPGYFPDTAYGVVLTNGAVTVQDMQLIPIVPVTVTGDVSEFVLGGAIPGAIVQIENADFTYNTTTDGSGNFTISSFLPGEYVVTVGLWGYITVCETHVFNLSNTSVSIQLSMGYADDFALDLGWTETSTASTGIFERADPIEISSWGGGGVTVPEFDLSGDCGGLCYVTGNGASSAGADDVDDGETQITSPSIDLLSSYANPYLNFSRYWDNSGGSGGAPRDDSLRVIINDGTTDHIIAYYTEDDNDNAWTSLSYRIRDYVVLTSNMTVTFHTADEGSGHLVEASIDGFFISDSATTEQLEIANNELKLYPNPTKDRVTISSSDQNPVVELYLYDISGRVIDSRKFNPASKLEYVLPFESGTYLIRLVLSDGDVVSEKVIKD